MRNALALCVLGLMACGGGDPHVFGPRFNLAEPFYVEVEDALTVDGKSSFPHPAEWRQAMQNAISLAHGRVTQDSGARQRLTLYNTDGDKCIGRNVFAFTDPQTWNRIALCHSLIVVNDSFFSPSDRKLDLMLHELGHALGGHGGHIGGDDIPFEECPYPNIMAWNLNCHLGLNAYKGADLAYVCDSGNAVNGICAPSRL
jgi:hypothetical protein